LSNNQYSDHKKPFTDLKDYLPEVYKSDINQSVFDAALNRHLTKDDTSRVAGYIGEKNTGTLVDRQIKESTPHRQAYQLAPTMVAQVGTVTSALSYKAFQAQLKLMGVNIDRLPLWANTMQFNWVPPVNIDMIVNYQDYFWSPADPTAPAQYFTIENRCNKATSKVKSYQEILNQRGTAFNVTQIDYVSNSMFVDGLNNDLFIEGFVFFTKSAEPNLSDKFWTVASSTYILDSNTTQITLVEPLATVAATPPVPVRVGQWWFDTSVNRLKSWSGTAWVITVQQPVVQISLAELGTIYQTDANCACNQDYGWDVKPWDDNQLLPSNIAIWNTAVLAAISFATEAEWVTANGFPNPSDNTQYKIWNDTTNNQLKEYDFSAAEWKVAANNFSAIVALSTGNSRWDQTIGCEPQEANQWSEQNEWIHKSEVQSHPNARRAQVPIIEYSSSIELNKWSKRTFAWFYRATADAAFKRVDTPPARFELEPIKGFATTNVLGSWYVYLHNDAADMNRNIDYTDAFPAGSKIRFTDDGILSEVYTVASAEFREILSSDPMAATIGSNQMVTVLRLEGSIYTAPLVGGGSGDPLNTRIVPVTTTYGDTWLGYHIHWLLSDIETTTTASATVPSNLYKKRDAASSISATPTPGNLPHYNAVTVGRTYQELTVLSTTLTTVMLQSALQYNGATNTYATPDSDDLRVYVNGIRQYGNYTETTSTVVPDYTVIGTAAHTNVPLNYVTGVVFDLPLPQFATLRIEVGPASFDDMGVYAVPVRTIEDETAFAIAVANGTQPVYRSLSEDLLLEQVKLSPNQYPLFNVYDVVTSDVVKASPIFAYREDPSYPVDSNTGKRIVVSSDGREYDFEQYLLDRDDNILYGYRTVSAATRYWYSPITNQVKFWDGTGWTNKILVATSNGVAVRVAIVSRLDPANPYTLSGDLWYEPVSKILRQRTGSTWVVEPNIVVNGSDPQLRTIWRHGTNEYVPQYVDKDRQPIVQGSPAGDWELVDQWMFNPEHQNKQVVKYTQLITHFSTILDAQPKIPGLLGGGIYALSQDDYDYGLGGTIKEHNDSFDTLISAVNVTNTTPINVIEFASQQYATCLTTIRELFNQYVPTVASQFGRPALASLSTFVANAVIDAYESNDFASQVFADTSAYDETTGKGIKNWVATAPMFGLSDKFRPHLNVNGTTVTLFHHDGHRSTIAYTPGEQDRLAKAIVKTPDPRTGGILGLTKTTPPPATRSAFTTAYNSPMRVGVFWYQLGGGARRLYKLAAYDITPVAPSFYDSTGAQIPDGTMYFNLSSNSVWTKQGLAWIETSATGAGDISSLWQIVDFSQLLGEVLLEVETRLYDVTPDRTELAFDYSTLHAEPNVYEDLYEDRFLQYVAEREIAAPMVNVGYTAANAFSWNYAASLISTPPANGSTPAAAGSWQALYTNCYGTPYPHLEPWKLQGFHDKPTWWDAEYLETVAARRWKYNHATQTGMWQNIRNGVIPVGRTNPDGSPATGLPNATTTYNYFSVNISDNTIAGGYAPDALLPPYYDNSAIVLDTLVRSIYTSYSAEVVAPDADFAFGEVGPTEWEWTVSTRYPYDNPVIAFEMQPARMLHYTFGPQYTLVDGLQVETTFHQVYSHEDALFHGDVYDTDQVYHVRGLNQWYVNLNRYNNFDTNGEFRELWVGWNPHLTYQFAGIVDTGTVEISNKYFDVISQDYNILLVNNGVIRDLWADSFNVSLLHIPPAIIQYNNQSAWKMEIDTVSSIARSISYYGVKAYPFTANVGSNEFSMFRYSIVAINAAARRIFVDGDQTGAFTPGIIMSITASPSNNGNYTVVSSLFDSTLNQTRVVVQEPIVSSSNVGMIELGSRSVSWNTGDPVVLSTTKFLPAPLFTNTVYYIIRTGARTFKLAETPDEAINGIYIDITSAGVGNLTVAQLQTSFNVYGGQGNTADLWFHYVIDKSDIRTFTPPFIVGGMQTLINIIDGYSAYQKDMGLMLGTADSNDFDPLTGRLTDWQSETERFMDWAFGMRNVNVKVNDAYPVKIDSSLVSVDVPTSTISVVGTNWTNGQAVRLLGTPPAPIVAGLTYYLISTPTPNTFQLGTETTPTVPVNFTNAGSGVITATTDRLLFTQTEPVWKNGTSVVMSSSQVLPDPIIAGSPYHIVLTGVPGYVRLSTSASSTDTTSYVQFETSGVGQLALALKDVQRTFPHFEMNPTRDNVWIDTPLGVLSNVIEGPYTDIRIQQTIYDQYNRPMGPDRLTVYRQDRRSHIAVRPEIPNDVDIIFDDDPYNYIHIGGGHFFTEGYEHFLIFNDSTVSGSLIYNPFLGLSTKRFDMDYFEKEDYTLRPTLGGFYLLDNEFHRNIEGAVDDMRNYYDTFALSETTEVARRSRKLLGYNGDMPFLDWLNTNAKTQFLFYKGMIQTKGSINSVKAYINSRRFVDAKIDEFWAYKLAEFGDARPRFYPRIKLLSTDSALGDVRLKFLSQTDDPTTIEFTDAQENGFHLVSFADETRWDAFPEQRARILSPLFLDGEVTDVVSTWIGTTIPAGAQNVVRYFYNTSTSKLFAYDSSAGTWTIDVTADHITVQPLSTGSTVYFNHGVISDDVRLFRRNPLSGSLTNYTTDQFTIGTGAKQYMRVNSETVSLNVADFTGIIDIYAINPSATRINPAKLIDTKANTVVTELPMWHPAIGVHSYIAIHNVDLQHESDPARYTTTLDTDPSIAWHKVNPWNNAEVGISWLDTSSMGYVPYYDSKVFPTINDRLFQWGKLAPWSTVRAFEWVQSTVPPSEWDGIVLAQMNAPIAQSEKATGTPRMTTFRRQRVQVPVTLDPLTSRVTMTPLIVSELDEVLLNADVFPATGIAQSIKYIVTNVVGNTFQLTDPQTEQLVTISDAGTNVKLTPAFDATDWHKQILVVDRISGPFAAANARAIANDSSTINWTNGYTLPGSVIAWAPSQPSQWTIGVEPFGDTVDVYVNGQLRDTAVLVSIDTATGLYKASVASPFVLNEFDTIDIVRPERIPTSEELAFNPDLEDDGTTLIQWTRDYEYTVRTVTNGDFTTNQTPTTYYYFWVEGMTTRRTGNSGISVQEIAQQLAVIPTSHIVFQTPKDDVDRSYPDPYGITSDARYATPIMYRDAIVRKVSNYLTDDNRYVVQFTRDLTLRDDITANGRQMNLKNKHEEWFLFRQEQPGTIDRKLWNRLTESMCGYTLADPTIRVPSSTRELYDARNGTDTRFGLGVDQAFVDKTLAINTVLTYLRDPTKDFTPTDINAFFDRYGFDTPARIVEAMDAIYTSFTSTHVNAIWFSTLQDALSTKAKYAELLKTSWVALHGIRVLEVGGLFD